MPSCRPICRKTPTTFCCICVDLFYFFGPLISILVATFFLLFLFVFLFVFWLLDLFLFHKLSGDSLLFRFRRSPLYRTCFFLSLLCMCVCWASLKISSALVCVYSSISLCGWRRKAQEDGRNELNGWTNRMDERTRNKPYIEAGRQALIVTLYWDTYI